ncbi:MAG: phage integrase SAM-like domain-containing protein, partial [Mycobacterium sp.]|nr:phage integrase SAM-like domain-containing protein [Mycobacterium sp.]
MANKPGHRRFGLVRALPSKRYQASYLGPDGRRRYAPNTFAGKKDAEAWLSTIETDMLRGEWTDPLLGKIKLEKFGKNWIKTRKIRKTTYELYDTLFRLHISPILGDKELQQISAELVRSWRQELLETGRSEVTAAKSYRLLRAIMNTAFDDGRIKRNPCRIPGADQEPEFDRPVATVPQVYALAGQMPGRFRVLILAAGFSGLRWGELIALRRRDLDLDAGTVKVARRLAQLRSGEMLAGPTKSSSGYRTVALPALIIPELRDHMADYVGKAPDSLIFLGEKG